MSNARIVTHHYMERPGMLFDQPVSVLLWRYFRVPKAWMVFIVVPLIIVATVKYTVSAPFLTLLWSLCILAGHESNCLGLSSLATLPIRRLRLARLIWCAFVLLPVAVIGFGAFASVLFHRLSLEGCLLVIANAFAISGTLAVLIFRGLSFMSRSASEFLVTFAPFLIGLGVTILYILFSMLMAASFSELTTPRLLLLGATASVAVASFFYPSLFAITPGRKTAVRRTPNRRIVWGPRSLTNQWARIRHICLQRLVKLLYLICVLLPWCLPRAETTTEGDGSLEATFFFLIFISAGSAAGKIDLRVYKSLPLSTWQRLAYINFPVVRNLIVLAGLSYWFILPGYNLTLVSFVSLCLFFYGTHTICWLPESSWLPASVVNIVGSLFVMALIFLFLMWAHYFGPDYSGLTPHQHIEQLLNAKYAWGIAGMVLLITGLWLNVHSIRNAIPKREGVVDDSD